MREIKFRAWIKNKENEMRNEMINVEEIEWNIKNDKIIYVVCSPYEFDIKDVELMQFTGLKDKNGKEIFEGDILKRDTGEEIEGDIDFLGTDGYYIVEIKNQRLAYPIKRPEGWSDIFESDEVIGNIYENKELLEVNKE